jgi:hypothetical protein
MPHTVDKVGLVAGTASNPPYVRTKQVVGHTYVGGGGDGGERFTDPEYWSLERYGDW